MGAIKLMSLLRYKYKIRVGKVATARLLKEWDAVRHIWNYLTALSREPGFRFDGSALGKQVTQYSKDNPWLREYSGGIRSDTYRKWAELYVKHLSSLKKGKAAKIGRLRFKSKDKDAPSLSYRAGNYSLKSDPVTEKDVLYLAKARKSTYSEPIRCNVVWSRPLPDGPKTCTIYRDSVGDWFASFVVEVEDQPLEETGNYCGIDWGSQKIATVYDYRLQAEGSSAEKSDLTKANEVNMGKVSRKLSRAKRGSNNYKRIKKTRAKLYRHMANSRKNSAVLWSREITSKYDYICSEDFKVKKLTQLAAEGKGPRRKKKAIARQYSDNAVSLYKATLEDLGKRRGREVISVPASYTTRICSNCLKVNDKIPLSQRVFQCSKCGHTDGRDLNASKNMLRIGMDTSEKDIEIRTGFNPAVVEASSAASHSVMSCAD